MTSTAAATAAAPEPAVPESVRVVLADAYRDAALADADMLRAVDLLEPLRDPTAGSVDLYRLLEQVDARAGESAGEPLLPVLDRVRQRIVRLLCETLTASVRTALARSPEAGLHEWLGHYAESLMRQREPVSRHLVGIDAPVPFPEPPGRAGLARWTDDLYAARWNQVMPLLTFLLDHAVVRTRIRVDLLVAAGELSLYILRDRPRAERFFAAAMETGPKDPRPWEGKGTYLFVEGDLDGASEAFERSIELGPDRSNGYRRLSDIAVDRDDLEAAERHLLRAISEIPHESDNYRALIGIYGRPQLFESHDHLIERLAAQADAVGPAFRYDTKVALGIAYRDNGFLDRALNHLRAAVYARPDRPEARCELAELYRLKHDPDRARQQCEVLLRTDSGYWPAHYQLALVCQDGEDWDGAIEHFERALAHLPPHWESTLSSCIARAHLSAGRPGQAAVAALDGLRRAPANPDLLRVMEETARQTLTADGRPAAERVLRQVRELRGAEYEAEYQQNRGDLYYDAGDYPSAVAAYELAIAADGTKAPYHRAAALAHREAHHWDLARAELERALRLDGDQALYEAELGALYNREANQLYESGRYADAADGYRKATELRPDDAVIHSNLALALELTTRPGGRATTLKEAVAAVTRAWELSGDPEYKLGRARLERLAAQVRAHGELVATAPMGVPVRITVADDLVPLVNPAQSGADFMYGQVPATRERVRETTGFALPGFRFQGDPNLPLGGYSIRVLGTEVARGTVVTGWDCLPAPCEAVQEAGVPAHRIRPAWHPVTRSPCSWVAPGEDGRTDDIAGLRGVNDTGFLLQHVEDVLRQHAWRLLGTDEAEQWLANVVAASGDDSPLGAAFPPQTRLAATRVLRALARDGIPLTSQVAELLADGRAREADRAEPEESAETVRRIRLALRATLPGNAPGVARSAVPPSLEAAAAPRPPSASGRPAVSVPNEHLLAGVLHRALVTGGRTAFTTSEPLLRPWLQRFAEGAIGPEQANCAGALESAETIPEAVRAGGP